MIERSRKINPQEALEAGIPLEVLLQKGIIDGPSDEELQIREQIRADAVREGEELKAKLQEYLSSPDSSVQRDVF